MGSVGSFEVLVSFKVPVATTDALAVVVKFGSLAFPDGFGPDLLLLSPPTSGEWVSLVGLGGGAIALPPNPCKDMVVGIGFHGGHHTLSPRKRMMDRNTITSSIFRNAYIDTLIKWESCWVWNSHVWILQGYAYLHWLMPHSKIWCIGALAFYHCCIKMWSCLLLHWVAKYFTSSTYVSSQFFDTNAPFSFPCFFFHQVFAWSFCSLHLQAMGKWCTNSNSLNGGDLPKGCRGTLDHVQGSPQGHNILFCHTHKAKMPSSQWNRAYCNAMSQSNIKGKWCTNSNSVNGGDLSKGCRGTLGHFQGSPKAATFYSVMLTRPTHHWANELEPITM